MHSRATVTAGYEIEPGKYSSEVHDLTGERYDFEKNILWDLPLWAVLPYVMLTFFPVCFFPGEFVYFLFLTFGYRRVTQRTILDDDLRRDLYRQIAAYPGIETGELNELTGVSRSRLRYHLAMLAREGKVATVCHRGRYGHFARNQRHTAFEQRIQIVLREEISQVMLGRLLESMEVDRNDLSERLGISGRIASDRMREFKGDGIVVTERDGRFVRYRLSEAAREFFDRHPEALRLPGHPGTESYPAEMGREISSG
ncbi:DNA-binding protein [Methanoculleus sp.]|uniref:winged helix-turn-helix transcriptional regulator n=1 Tax=Methanoculleus sp. TaxID=90427 RepID=UPI002600E281|nr:DNA-binding protein [Methanoculleus sp.]